MKRKLFGVLRRAGILVLVVWTVVSLVTLLIELVPGDPAIAVLGEQATPEQLAQFRSKHGLDRPPFFFAALKVSAFTLVAAGDDHRAAATCERADRLRRSRRTDSRRRYAAGRLILR